MLHMTHLDHARRIYIGCAWNVALLGEEDLDIAAAQLFILVGEFLTDFVRYVARTQRN